MESDATFSLSVAQCCRNRHWAAAADPSLKDIHDGQRGRFLPLRIDHKTIISWATGHTQRWLLCEKLSTDQLGVDPLSKAVGFDDLWVSHTRTFIFFVLFVSNHTFCWIWVSGTSTLKPVWWSRTYDMIFKRLTPFRRPRKGKEKRSAFT